MADRTRIEWTDATWTPIRARTIDLQDDGSGRERIGWHCEHVSDGCRNCYAERRNAWIGTGHAYRPANLRHTRRNRDNPGHVSLFMDEKMLGQPQRWRAARRIFTCSMTDLFARFVPDTWVDQVFAVMAESPWHQFQVLTKRSARMRAYMTDPVREASVRRAAEDLAARDFIRLLDDPRPWPLPHVMMMVSAETQREADERIPDLQATPAASRGLSLEPLLGPVTLAEHGLHGAPNQIEWVICGGESGPKARPMHAEWARSLRDECRAAGVPYFFKQWGEWLPWTQFVDSGIRDEHERTRYQTAEYVDGQWRDIGRPDRWDSVDGDIDDEQCVGRVGRTAAGRKLDGEEIMQCPSRAARPGRSEPA